MSDLRQQVRRDDDLPPMARLLFAEIWQMNEGDGECYAEDEWLGRQIGAAESTVRRHRLTLRKKGYIKQYKSGGRRYLEPNEMINIDQSDQKKSESTTNDDQNDQHRSNEVINTDQHRGSNNPESASGARARGDRWAFLPSQHHTLLPTIKAEAGPPDDNPDVLNIASRHLQRPESDLAGTVDGHLDEHPTDEVIAAYVIGGKKGDRPLAYAKHILTMGWKEQGGDGASVALPDDEDVIHFGSTPP